MCNHVLFLFAEECKTTQLGQEYRGTLSKTKNGLTCQAWSSQEPYRHRRTSINYTYAGLVKNYCRNPDEEPDGPWCYTTSPTTRWEYCDVKFCGESSFPLAFFTFWCTYGLQNII